MAAGTSSARRRAGVPGRGEYAAAKTVSKRISRMARSVAWNCSSVSPQNPTMMSVEMAMSRTASRIRARRSRVVRERVLATHSLQHLVVAGLDGQVQVLHDGLARGHGVDQPVGEIPRVRRDEAEPRNRGLAVCTLDRVDGGEQFGQVRTGLEIQAPAAQTAPSRCA